MSTSNDPFNQVLNGWVGSAVAWSFIVQNNDGSPTDVSGWTIMFTVKKSFADTDLGALYVKDWIMGSGVDGTIGGELPDDYTHQAGPGTLQFDVRIKPQPGDEPQMYYRGIIILGKTAGTRVTPMFDWTPLTPPPAS